MQQTSGQSGRAQKTFPPPSWRPQYSVDLSLSSANTLKIENTHNRDVLIANEKKYQKQWQEKKVFESDPPSISEIPLDSVKAADIREQHPKYFGTFAYPYMNGTLHAGHSFTTSKVEFTSGLCEAAGEASSLPTRDSTVLVCRSKLARTNW